MDSRRALILNFSVAGFFILVLFFLLGQSLYRESSRAAVLPSGFAVSPAPSVSYPRVTYLPVNRSGSSSAAPDSFQPSFKAGSVLLYNLTKHKPVFQYLPDEKMQLASVTKLMTAYLAEREVKNKNRIFIVQEQDLQVEYANPKLKPGASLTFSQALRFLLIASDNSVANLIARETASTTVEFVRQMNWTALMELDMQNTRFYDAIGLAANVSTASDLVKLTDKILRDYPEIFRISLYPQTTILAEGGESYFLKNTNILVDKIPGLIGGKTGYTPEAGGSLLVVFQSGSDTLVSVVLGSEDRFGDTAGIIQWYLRQN